MSLKTRSIVLFFLLNTGIAGAQTDPMPFYRWFQSHTQANTLYGKGSRLFVFNANTPLYARPNPQSEVLLRLSAGSRVTTQSFPEDNPGPIQMRGYQDYWYEVTVLAPTGFQYRGFLWGGDLAKGWSVADLDADGSDELLLLGIYHELTGTQAGNAALKLIKGGRVQLIQPTGQQCLSEDCAVNVLLRVIPDPIWKGMKILEVSTVSLGCNQGMERNFYYWTGKRFTRVYQRRWTESATETFSPFQFQRTASASNEARSYHCQFSYMDRNHNPVWRCTPAEGPNPGIPKTGRPSRAR